MDSIVMSKVYIVVEGGVIQDVLSTDEGIDIIIIDHDDNGWGDDDTTITGEEAAKMIERDKVKNIPFEIYDVKK